jgi:hypothetical protein
MDVRANGGGPVKVEADAEKLGLVAEASVVLHGRPGELKPGDMMRMMGGNPGRVGAGQLRWQEIENVVPHGFGRPPTQFKIEFRRPEQPDRIGALILPANAHIEYARPMDMLAATRPTRGRLRRLWDRLTGRG